MTNATNNVVQFDSAQFNKAIADIAKLRDANKNKIDTIKRKEGVSILAALFPAIEYAAQTYDMQPLALWINKAKPTSLEKRIIAATFPNHQFAILGDAKRPALVVESGKSKVTDAQKMQVIRDAFNAGDSILCDQIKDSFPAPELGKKETLAKLGKSLSSLAKKNKLSRADILAVVNALDI